MKINSLQETFQLREIINRLRSKGMMLLMDGSLSVLDDDANIFITPSEVEMLNPEPCEMIIIGRNGKLNESVETTVEIEVHKAIYKARLDVRAICRAYSPALSVIYNSYNQNIFSLHPRILKLVGNTHISEYIKDSSEDSINDFISRFSNGASNIILDNAGVITTGSTLLEAFQKLENLDHIAKAIIKANKLGELNFPNHENLKFFNDFKPKQYEGLRGRKSSVDFSSHKNELISLIHNSYKKDFITGVTGSFSVKTNTNSFFISPDGIDKQYLGNEDLVLVNKGKVSTGNIPDDNIWIHDAIYKSSKNINAIALILPTDITAYAFLVLMPEMQGLRFTRVPFSILGDVDLLAGIIRSGYQALLIENDMLLVTANSTSELSKRIDMIGYSSRKNILGSIAEA